MILEAAMKELRRMENMYLDARRERDELYEALKECAAWLSAYQHAFPDSIEKGKRIDKMRADLRSAATGNGVTNVGTAALNKARAALLKASPDKSMEQV